MIKYPRTCRGIIMSKLFFIAISLLLLPATGFGAITGVASTEYVTDIVNALGVPDISKKLDDHIGNVENPHAVTAAQVGLGNVKDVDNTNADNLISGTVNIARLPVGNTGETVASGADARFNTLPTVAPTDNPPDGRVYVWFE